MTIHVFWFTEPSDNKPGVYQFSNQEIQKNFLIEFAKYDKVVWHHANTRGRVTDDPNDILVGHPPWPPAAVKGNGQFENWAFDNGFAPGETHPNTFMVYPWARAFVSHPATDPYVEMFLKCRALFGMGGTDHYDFNIVHAEPDTLWRRTQKNFVRINMGCDARILPYKTAAHGREPGMLHVSSLRGYKRPEHMLASVPVHGCALYIATENTENVQKLAAEGRLKQKNIFVVGALDNGNPAANDFILNKCSYYFHLAREPQATTILENAGRGLVPLITGRSGFYCPDAIYLTDDDPMENQRIVKEALSMPDEEYARRSGAVRQHILTYHSGERICGHMYKAGRALIEGGDVPRRGEDSS